MKPCPFDDNYSQAVNLDGNGYYYQCVYCHIHTGIYDTKEEAEIAWNAYDFRDKY